MNEPELGQSAADRLDRLADAGDWVADKRDMAANLESWLLGNDDFGAEYDQRQAAWRDRMDARAHRSAAADKRSGGTGRGVEVEDRAGDDWWLRLLSLRDWEERDRR